MTDINSQAAASNGQAPDMAVQGLGESRQGADRLRERCSYGRRRNWRSTRNAGCADLSRFRVHGALALARKVRQSSRAVVNRCGEMSLIAQVINRYSPNQIKKTTKELVGGAALEFRGRSRRLWWQVRYSGMSRSRALRGDFRGTGVCQEPTSWQCARVEADTDR